MGERSEHPDERSERPAWASVPTMPWSRVVPTPRSGESSGASAVPGDDVAEDGLDHDLIERELAERERRRRRAFDTDEQEEYRPRRAAPESTVRVPRPPDPARFGPPPAPNYPMYPGEAQRSYGAVTPQSGVPVVPAPPPPPPVTEPISPVAGLGGPRDPELLLGEVQLRYDPETLHEIAEDERALLSIKDMLTAKIDTSTDNPSRARLLGLRSVVSRTLGDLRPALSDAKMALVHAEATGQLRRVAVAQARLANVLVRLGEYDQADRLLALANSAELPDRLRATIHHYAGKSAFAQDRYIEACQHFEKALELRRDGDPELVAATEVALDALFGRVAERGWGPYPRSRDDILQPYRPPVAAFDEHYDRWGFQDAEGNWPVAPQWADVQPFRDGVAWVRPVGVETWGLIDEQGRLLIDPRSGYLGVGSFSDGLAWVSRDGQAGWIAIDKGNRLIINGGFDDVRPFRRGIAIVRSRGKWGAVEKGGRLVVPFAFDAFATGLADGRYVEGFTDEGLAIVELGGRKGVVDRTGRLIVQPAYPTLVIHPVAFLIVDANHRWGALDRTGAPLVTPSHASRNAVAEELEHLLADTRPLL